MFSYVFDADEEKHLNIYKVYIYSHIYVNGYQIDFSSPQNYYYVYFQSIFCKLYIYIYISDLKKNYSTSQLKL